MSIELDLPDYAGLLAAVERCEACGWCGVVLEAGPTLQDKAGIGARNWRLGANCPKCGKPLSTDDAPVDENE